MAEITGGQLNYSVTVDVDQLKKGMSDAEGNIQGFTEVAEKAGTSIDNAFSKSGSRVKDFTGIVRENVSIQKQVIKELESQIKEVQNRASGMAPGIGQATILNEAKGLEKELAAEKAALADLEIAMSKTAVTSTTLGTKLAEAKNHLAELNLASKEGKEVTAEQFREAEAEVKKYGEAISDTNARTKALTAGTIGSLAQGLSLVTGTMAMGTSLMGAFGGKSEELNQIMLKTQALLAATVTLQEIKNTTIQKGGVISGIMTVQEMARARAINLATAGTLRATIAQRALNLVANANPYVLLATAIITVVGAIALYTAASSKASKTTQDLNKKMADSVAEPVIEYKKLQTQWNALGNDLKAKKKFIDENQNSFKKLGVSVSGVSDAENVFVKNSTAMVASMMMRARAAAAMELATEQYKIGLQKQLEYEQDEKILKTGSLTQKMAVRSGRNVSLLKGESLDGKDNMNSANELVRRSVGYSKSEQDFIKNSGIAPYKEIEKEKKTLREKNKPTKNDVADEFLPPGSVAEIQKRLSAIDEALSKATDKGAIEALKKKRIAAAEELAEALKKIEIKSLEDRASAQEKYSEAYNIIAELQGKEAADKMYGPLMEGAQSYYGWLTNEQDKLIQKGGLLSETDKQNLVFLTQKINEIEGKKNAFQNFTDGIDEALAKIPTLSGQLEFLQNKAEEQLSLKGNKSFDDGEQKFLKEKQDALLQQQKATFEKLLEEQQTYQEKSLALQKEYEDVKNSDLYKNASDSDKGKIDASYSKKFTDLFFEQMQGSEEFGKVFIDMNEVATEQLEKFKIILQQKLSEAKTIEEKIKIGEFIKKLEQAISGRNFIPNFSKAIKAMGDDSLSTAEKIKIAKEEIQKFQDQLGFAKEIISGVSDIFTSLGGNMDSAFGDILSNLDQTISGLQQFGEGASKAIEGFASGNILQGVAGTIKAIGGAIKAVSGWLNGDKKKERNIKRQAAQLKELETAYNNLAFAAERAFGSQKYSGQRDLIKNLEQQKAVIQGMLNTENSKKKKDNEKIAGYQSQIQQINQSIAQIKEGIIKDVLQTDVIDAASKVGDALVDAFSRGEDSVKSLENAANDMIKNLLRNQLNLALQNKMKPILDQLLASSGFNQDGTGTFTGLTPEQIAAFKAQVVAAGQSMQGFLEGYADIFGSLDPANAQGLKGDIKGITEKTAGALEAQINAMRIIQAEMYNIGKSNQQTFLASLQNLIMIEANTRNLIQIRQDISEMNGKMAKGLAGI